MASSVFSLHFRSLRHGDTSCVTRYIIGNQTIAASKIEKSSPTSRDSHIQTAKATKTFMPQPTVSYSERSFGRVFAALIVAEPLIRNNSPSWSTSLFPRATYLSKVIKSKKIPFRRYSRAKSVKILRSLHREHCSQSFVEPRRLYRPIPSSDCAQTSSAETAWLGATALSVPIILKITLRADRDRYSRLFKNDSGRSFHGT